MDEDPEDPWSLVRLALGSLAGESWRLKQARFWNIRVLTMTQSSLKTMLISSKGQVQNLPHSMGC